ncbi:hypothetical protein NKDENANG_02015 [Candidatus Entotheonellaceae bacterium PAL068K]
MARRAFYSFHYDFDNWRASQVRNMGIIEGNRPATDNDWEQIKRGGDAAIKRCDETQGQTRMQLAGCRVFCDAHAVLWARICVYPCYLRHPSIGGNEKVSSPFTLRSSTLLRRRKRARFESYGVTQPLPQGRGFISHAGRGDSIRAGYSAPGGAPKRPGLGTTRASSQLPVYSAHGDQDQLFPVADMRQ